MVGTRHHDAPNADDASGPGGCQCPGFTYFFSKGGGIILEHCTVTEDGVRTALEFNAVRWGEVDLPPQAGVAIYERGRSGRLHEARIYDDVQGPVEDV